MAPEVTESVVAVDPVSERALLGTAGDFLAPLEKAPPADARNAERLAGTSKASSPRASA